MGTISIHGLDPELERVLRERARGRHESLNRTIKEALALGLGSERSEERRHHVREMFSEFLGAWDEEEARAFDRTTAELRRVDPEDWR